MKRYLILAAGFLMQMCLGATYAWSVFVRPLRDVTGLSQGEAQIPFTTFYFAFPITLLFSGKILSTLGPRRAALIGTLLFGAGWVAAGMAGPLSFAAVIGGIGVMAGVGVGFAYIVPITVGNRWFPRQPGLVTGIGVAGFAVGAALVGMSGEALMLRAGATPFQAIALLGIVFLLLGLPAAAQMAFPPGSPPLAGPEAGRRDLLRSPEFRRLFPAMVAGLAAGFAVNTNLKDLGPAGDPAAGVAAVSTFAMANAGGRVIWGWLFDRTTPATVLRVNLLAQAVVLGAVIFVVGGVPSLLLFAALAGFNYGGVLVLYASTVARRWGLHNVGRVYGLLFTANIVAAPAPVAAGLSLDAFGSFLPAFLIFAAVAGGASLLLTPDLNRRPDP